MPDNKKAEIIYDYSGLLVAEDAPALERDTALLPSDLHWLVPRLEAAREQLLADANAWKAGAPVPPEKQPFDAGFFELPERLLSEDRPVVAQVAQAAQRLANAVDRVVVLGIGGSYMGARALMEACCHPFHNDLPRQRRGQRPRMYFEGNNVDSDAMRGLLDLLEAADDWGLVVISKSGGTLETAVAFRVFLQALRHACGNDQEKLRQRIVAITGQTGKLRSLVDRLGLAGNQVFDIPDGVGGRFSVFTPVGLLPAAIVGLDIAALLEGAAAMNQRFRSAQAMECPPLAYAGMSHLMELRRGATIRVLATWGKRLEAVGLWYDQLLAESLGKQGVGATPLTVVNTRDLHSRGQQHQEGRRDKLITNLYVEQCQREPLRIEQWQTDEDGLNKYAGKTVADVLAAAFTGTNQAYAADGRRTATIRLPRLDEFALGQLLQMLMIATVIEGKLIGINPYGQPGVEAYKQRMVAILQR